MERKTFVISGNNFSTLNEFYDEVQKVLTNNFKEFGRNLNAFNDILRGGFGRYEYGEKITLIWENSNKSKLDLGYPETIKYREYNLIQVHPSNIDSARKWLEQAEKGESQTLFDILIKIIQDNDNVELVLA
jgi:hypothetical protein